MKEEQSLHWLWGRRAVFASSTIELKNGFLTRVAGTAIWNAQIKPTKFHAPHPDRGSTHCSASGCGENDLGRNLGHLLFLSANNDVLRNGRIRQTRGTAFRVHKVSWRPLGGAVLIRGPWASLWLRIWLFYGSRERATYFRMPPCLKNATSMSFSKRVVTLKLFPVLVWKQRQTWRLDVAWTKIFMYKQIAV